MCNNKIYVTTMYRWGNRECDSYVVYAGFNKEKAIYIGNTESSYRGGKYEPEVLEITVDETVKYGIKKERIYGKVESYNNTYPQDGFSDILSTKEIKEVLGSDCPEKYIIHGSVFLEEEILVLSTTENAYIKVPFNLFKPSGDGINPDFKLFKIKDYGQTLSFGDYEAAVDWVLEQVNYGK